MINLAQELKCYEIIQSIPGIGELTAAMLIGELEILLTLKQINN